MVRFVAFGLGLSALVSVSAACSSTTEATTSTASVNKPVCPNFVTTAVASGTKCVDEGYLCGVGFPCGPYNQQAACTCTGGKWACVAPGGVEIPADTTDTTTFCVASTKSEPEVCPADVTSEGKQCKTAGKACYFKPSCANGTSPTPAFDNCTCEGLSGTAKDGGPQNPLTWVCTFAVCQ